jgi:hypothetical protein
VKAKLEAVDSEIATFEEEFMAHIIVPGTNQTMSEQFGPQLEHLTDHQGVPQLLLNG